MSESEEFAPFLVAVIVENEVVTQPRLIMARDEQHAIAIGATLAGGADVNRIEVLVRPF